MAKLYNQSKHPLKWTINMTTYTCDAYGPVDVPDMFVVHCKTRGLPLDVTPVAPEVRAQDGLAAATQAAKADELLNLRHECELLKASERTAKMELERALADLASAKEQAGNASGAASELKKQLDLVTSEKNETELLLNETALKLEEATKRAERTSATVADLQKQLDAIKAEKSQGKPPQK
jgi:hypothetical protein